MRPDRIEDAGVNAWQEAMDFGIDMALLEENLRRTPAQRFDELVRMQALFELLHPDHRPVVSSATRGRR